MRKFWARLLSLFKKDSVDPPAEAEIKATSHETDKKISQDALKKTESTSVASKNIFLSEEIKAFHKGLTRRSQVMALDELQPDDRIFLSGIIKKLKDNSFAIPLLPQAAIQISKLIGNPNSKITEYVRILAMDPSLSMEILKTANSAFYGFASQTQSIRDAVVRIGFTQTRGLLMVVHLKGKVLSGGVFHKEAEWLSDFSMKLAHLGRLLAPALGLKSEGAFTKGLLMHLEYFVILGAVSDISKDRKQGIQPTETGLFEAFKRFGPRIRELAAKKWDLEELLMSSEGQTDMDRNFLELRGAMVSFLANEPLNETIAGLPRERVEKCLVKAVGIDN